MPTRRRHSYTTLAERVNRLAAALAALGVVPGSTVAVMDWDSHRYLECFFAVPMMGAVLHTVNVRISPEQVLYTINHAADDVILVNAEFLPLLEQIHAKIRPGVKFVLINDGPAAPASTIEFAGEYESMLDAATAAYAFPALDEDTRATTFYTTGTTGLPKGVYYSHRQLVLHTMDVAHALAHAPHAIVRCMRRLHADHADVPCSRLGPALCRHHARCEAGLSGPLCARRPAGSDRAREASRSRIACRRSCR